MLRKSALLACTACVVLFLSLSLTPRMSLNARPQLSAASPVDRQIEANGDRMLVQGRQIFRFDTFGGEAFWGDTLHLHQAIEGSKLGGVGPGVSPATALAVGLKVDADALPENLVQALKLGRVNLNDPATTWTCPHF